MKKSNKNNTAWFDNLKLRYKFSAIYIIAIFIPVFTVLSATYVQMRNILKEKESDNIRSYIGQALTSMDNEITIYNNLANYISYNKSISEVLSCEYSSVYDMYDQFVSVIDPMLSSLKYFHSEIQQVSIYADKDMVRHGDAVIPISEIQNEAWYEDVIKDASMHWYFDGEKIFAAGRMLMLERNGMEGVLYISIDYDSIFAPFLSSYIREYGIFITDDSKELVFEDAHFSPEYEKYRLDYADFLQNQDNYAVFNADSQASGWKIYIYKPDELMVTSFSPIITIIIAALMAVFLTISIVGFVTSKFITKRMITLQKGMQEVEEGNLKAYIESDSTDEIGDLISGYNSMLTRLDALIKEVYESKIKEKEYEMRALQAQINPHFLYNTLSLINWKAIEADAMDISKITIALSSFYRTSLNKGRNVMPLSDEIKNMRAYLDIQLMMHDNSFDTDISIDEDILKYQTLNLILQPIIENSILHGIDMKTEGRGRIRVRGRSEGEEIVLTIEDNGVGMTDEQAQRILTENSKGYGVRNVNERIKLFYGSKYAIHIESSIGEGTRTTIKFPKIL